MDNESREFSDECAILAESGNSAVAASNLSPPFLLVLIFIAIRVAQLVCVAGPFHDGKPIRPSELKYGCDVSSLK